MANIRADIRQYAGASAFFYDSLDDALKTIRQPFPEELRQLGFEQAKKSDVRQHRSLLFHLWRMPQVAMTTGEPNQIRGAADFAGSSG